MEDTAHATDHLLLLIGEVELALDVAVHAFTGLTADGDDGSVGLGSLMLYAALRDVDLIEFGLPLIEKPHPRVLVGLELGFGIGHIFRIDVGELRCSGDAGVFQSVHHIHDVGHIDAARA